MTYHAYAGTSLSPVIREEQMRQLALERESVLRHLDEARRRVNDLLSGNVRVLILDLAHRDIMKEDFRDRALRHELVELQFGAEDYRHGAMFRHMLGFSPDDPRVEIWNVASDPDRKHQPLPDLWIATGGPAMPSELSGPVTANTLWMRAAMRAMGTLGKVGIPGIAVCLGHELWSLHHGATMDQVRGEVGTVDLQATAKGRSTQLLNEWWDDTGYGRIAAHHSEQATSMPPGSEVLAWNRACDYQAVGWPLVGHSSVATADETDQLVVSIQNHPELLARLLEALRYVPDASLAARGMNIHATIFDDTPRARQIWLRAIQLLARREQNK